MEDPEFKKAWALWEDIRREKPQWIQIEEMNHATREKIWVSLRNIEQTMNGFYDLCANFFQLLLKLMNEDLVRY